MRKIALLITLLLFIACGKEETVTVTTATAYGEAPSYWAQADASDFPITLKISTAFDASQKTQIQNMATEWSTQGGVNFFETSSTTGNPDYDVLSKYAATNLGGLDDNMGVYISTVDATDMPSAALAVTQIYGLTKNAGQKSEYIKIVHADIIVNEYGFDFTLSGEAGKYDLPTVILHELGHFLGLYHYTGELDSVMYPSIGTATVNRSLFTIDRDNIVDKYASNSNPANARNTTRSALSTNESVDRYIHELRTDGKCVHKKNGRVIKIHDHSIKIKN